jgi:ergothioneine biosynthesis protein EgtB
LAATKIAATSVDLLFARLKSARAQTDAIFDLIDSEALYSRPIPERHRLIFYLGHLEAFDWNLLGRGALGLDPRHAELDKLFSFGIDPTHGDLPTDRAEDWPAEARVREYNQELRETLDEQITNPKKAKALPTSIANGTLLHVAVEHRLMHAETLAYLLHQLPYDSKRHQEKPSAAGGVFVPRTVDIPAGVATLGQPRGATTAALREGERRFEFGWDNEFESMLVDVPAFKIGAYPVTNGEFLKFVRAGGYENSSLWDSESWAWKQSRGMEHPLYWVRGDGEWKYRGMFEEAPLALDCPVYVSHAEASAFGKWAGKSLPTEAQWHRAAYGVADGSAERLYPWGDSAPEPSRGNFDSSHWDPMPVTAHPTGASAIGVQDLLGNGWEWTATPFGPFPGFEPFPFYRGYSADFFDDRHWVMKGGSARTAACFLRRPFRNWFQPNYPYMYATFRCVEE